MAAEKILEKIPSGKPEVSAPETEKHISSEHKTERFVVPSEKTKEAVKPLEKTGEGNIVVSSQAQNFQKQQAQAIDNILSEGLNEIFLKMKPNEQREFKKKGEETVAQINKILSQTKVKVSKIVDLIRKWLKLIPGVNKFFLEQEVKIKADRIMNLKNKQ